VVDRLWLLAEQIADSGKLEHSKDELYSLYEQSGVDR
jgi:hypothetical protein